MEGWKFEACSHGCRCRLEPGKGLRSWFTGRGGSVGNEDLGKRISFCLISFITFHYVFIPCTKLMKLWSFHSKHGWGDFMSRNRLDMSHVWCSYKIYPNYYMRLIQVLCPHSRLQSVAITLYLLTIILVYSWRVVAGAVSKCSPSWVNASSKKNWLTMWRSHSCRTWCQSLSLKWKRRNRNFHRHLS